MFGRSDRYPLSVDDQRSFPEGFDGRVCLWDIDKTYLSTHCSSFKGLSRIPVEFAVDKKAIPGMPEILRGLRWGPSESFACVPLYFVSASPPQMRKVIERKMLLDGVEHDGIIFKDWLRVLGGLKPDRLKEQLGFKLCALLTGRRARPLSTELLFGDDTERDAEAYHLYARIVSGELTGDELETTMTKAGVADYDRRCVRALLDGMPSSLGRVERIYIHLENKMAPASFERYGGLVLPVHGACQLSVSLYGVGLVSEATVKRACNAACNADHRIDVDNMVEDAVERGLVDQNRVAEIGW